MKTIISFLFSVLMFTSYCADSKYIETMSKTIKKMNSEYTIDNLTEAANTFERIGLTETAEWLPLYYVAYCNIQISYLEGNMEKKGQYIDKGQQFIDKALKITTAESELYALQAFLYPSWVTIDPMTRGMEFMSKLTRAVEKAISLNPDNPRPYYLNAISLLNMPAAFGGGADIAKPLFQKAKEKFDGFKPATVISPDWGKEHNESELNKL